MDDPPVPPANLETEREAKRQRTAASGVEALAEAPAAAGKPARKKAAPSGVGVELGQRLAAAHDVFLRDKEQLRYFHLCVRRPAGAFVAAACRLSGVSASHSRRRWDMSTVCPHWLVGRDVRVTMCVPAAGQRLAGCQLTRDAGSLRRLVSLASPAPTPSAAL